MQFNMERGAPNQDHLENIPEYSGIYSTAYTMAERAHEGRLRAEGTPYITHCKAVEKIISSEWGISSPDLRIAALLHDTIEDTTLTLNDIENEFGPNVAFLVDGVSQLRSEKQNGVSKIENDRETVRKIFSKNLIDPNVGVLKLADRLHNMRTLGFMPVDKQIAKANETKSYAKMAESLGMWKVMRELEDLSMEYSCPEDFEKYSRTLNADPRTEEKFKAWLKSTLEFIAADASIDANVETRMISLPKLKNKMGKDLPHKINDLISFRVIVPGAESADTRNNVYKMLGAVRQNFAEIEDDKRFDDFYFKPRDNDYSAIQLTLDFQQGSTEIAITSSEKEDFNRWGVVSLIRKGDTDLSKHALKLVFTETDEAKFLKLKATGYDFAFANSHQMGARAKYVFIDGERFPISTVLPNGARIRIELGEPRIAPEKESKEYSLPATIKIIDEMLSDEERSILKIKGKEAIGNIIAKRGLIDLADLSKIDKCKGNLEHLLFILGTKNLVEDLYYKIGAGVMDTADLEKHLDDAEITKEHLGLTSILIEGPDAHGITSLVSSKIDALGGNINPQENRTHNGIFTWRMVVENLSRKDEKNLERFLNKDRRFTNVIVV